ncbi:gastrokine-1-like [Carettochelys insculpta]|uniref:gastrokine-1-like n=1 Tax=Carettochelys insculpta TaxID=44489 RepID=UPI003EC04E0B
MLIHVNGLTPSENWYNTLLIVVLFGVFLTQTLATDNVNVNNQGNDGRSSHQTVSINNDKHVVNTDSNDGWNSWNSVWDYKNGFMATRIFSKKSCIIAKMNKNVMPDIVTIPKMLNERKKTGAQGPPLKQMRYIVSKTKISDQTPYGKNIEALCKGLPTHMARETQRPKGANFFDPGCCFDVIVLGIVDIVFCGEVVLK